MDTLIDNRNFPPEMQEQKLPSQENKTPWMLIILVIIAVGLIVFLLCRIFAKKDARQQEIQQKSVVEEQVQQVNIFERKAPKITEKERNERIRTFFGQ